MEVLTAEETYKWLERFKDEDDYVKFDGKKLYYTHPESKSIYLKFPKENENLPGFVRSLTIVGYESIHFEGASIVFGEWGVWQQLNEVIGYQIIESMHAAAGQPKSFEVAPGHTFRADELTKARGMLLQPIIFGWDADYLPQWAYGGCSEFFIHISHDGYALVVTKTESFYQKAIKELAEAELDPKPWRW